MQGRDKWTYRSLEPLKREMKMTNNLWPRETPVLTPPEPLPTNYGLYVNGRFGFQIGYPRAFQARPEPVNGDGRTFTSEDRKAYLEVCGWNTHSGQTLADEYYLALTDLAGQIQYQRKGSDHFEITWVDAGRGTFGGPGLGTGLGATAGGIWGAILGALNPESKPGGSEAPLGMTRTQSEIAEQAYLAAGEVAKQTGLSQQFIYDQWAQETGNFSSRITKDLNNLAGIRIPGTKTYESFGSIDEFAKRYATLIESKRYRAAGINQAHSDEQFAAALQRGGWYGNFPGMDAAQSLQNYVRGMQRFSGDYAELASRHLKALPSFATPPAGSQTVNVTQSTTVGDVKVSVTQPGATPEQIHKTTLDAVEKAIKRQNQLNLAQLGVQQ